MRRQVVHRFNSPRHIENRRHRRTLLAIDAIAALVGMVFADMVFTTEGALKVPRALVERSTLRTAAFPLVHAAGHIRLTFPYARKRTMKVNPQNVR